MAKVFTEREKQFIVWSLKERLMLKDFWKSRDKDFTINSTSKAEKKEKWDAIITSAETKYLVECKSRNIPSTKYKSSKIMQHKYNYLVGSCNAADQEGEPMSPLYVVFYTDNKVAVFNLYNISPEWTIRYGHLNSSTTTKNPIVPQSEFDIPLSEATLYDFRINKDYNALACEVAETMFPGNEFVINRLLE